MPIAGYVTEELMIPKLLILLTTAYLHISWPDWVYRTRSLTGRLVKLALIGERVVLVYMRAMMKTL